MKIKIVQTGCLFAALSLVLSGGSSIAYAKERKLSREMVPVEVLNSFQKSYPKGVVRGYEEEIEHGKTFFEIESMEGETRRDLLFSPSGEIVEIEEVVPKTEIPESIQQVIGTQFPQAEIRRVEKTTRHGRTSYEIGFKQGDKKFSREFDVQGLLVKD